MVDKEIVINNLVNLKQAKNAYDTQKHKLELERLKLKYSNEYTQYKTIKEKEERARLATAGMEMSVLRAKKVLREAELNVQIDELDMYYFIEECCCDKEDCKCKEEPFEEPNIIEASSLIIDHDEE